MVIRDGHMPDPPPPSPCLLLSEGRAWRDARAVSARQHGAGAAQPAQGRGAGGSPSPQGGCRTLSPQHSTAITPAAAGCPEATTAPLE